LFTRLPRRLMSWLYQKLLKKNNAQFNDRVSRTMAGRSHEPYYISTRCNRNVADIPPFHFSPPADERSELRLVISVKMIPRNSLMSLFLPKLNDFFGYRNKHLNNKTFFDNHYKVDDGGLLMAEKIRIMVIHR